ncbi:MULTISPECIES: DUF1307 domain-containing protein [unclassified Granulicatella]|uniref:DUF1307 domain-containing protein n=1 Tax=unclassified Granulicatella TaxID=2630493 RepID=UPI0010740A85|nr:MULTISPECIES: DUF1307 domain-containing protein [unclassified Granulicatella]MBF0780360.1 DUF1307 domain-containing protein [Granulicatella sp. 19428wC4_WM01]TFU95492.1 DUF1307 domain-containing protein [Granulicatella sp. WM01]
MKRYLFLCILLCTMGCVSETKKVDKTSMSTEEHVKKFGTILYKNKNTNRLVCEVHYAGNNVKTVKLISIQDVSDNLTDEQKELTRQLILGNLSSKLSIKGVSVNVDVSDVVEATIMFNLTEMDYNALKKLSNFSNSDSGYTILLGLFEKEMTIDQLNEKLYYSDFFRID